MTEPCPKCQRPLCPFRRSKPSCAELVDGNEYCHGTGDCAPPASGSAAFERSESHPPSASTWTGPLHEQPNNPPVVEQTGSGLRRYYDDASPYNLGDANFNPIAWYIASEVDALLAAEREAHWAEVEAKDKLIADLEKQMMLPRAEDREAIERLQALADQHNRLCLAELGGPGVWPCGCHVEIVDSYGAQRLLSEADGEVHQPCDHHAALQPLAKLGRLAFAWWELTRRCGVSSGVYYRIEEEAASIAFHEACKAHATQPATGEVELQRPKRMGSEVRVERLLAWAKNNCLHTIEMDAEDKRLLRDALKWKLERLVIGRIRRLHGTKRARGAQ